MLFLFTVKNKHMHCMYSFWGTIKMSYVLCLVELLNSWNSLGSRAQLTKINAGSLRLQFPNMHFSSSVRDLGFILDPVLSLSDHVNSVSRSCFYYLRQLRAIRQSLPLHAITTLVHALICSRIDYGNAVYIGLSSTNTSKLQAILNAAARLIVALQSLTICPISSVTPSTGSPSASASNSRSRPWL